MEKTARIEGKSFLIQFLALRALFVSHCSTREQSEINK